MNWVDHLHQHFVVRRRERRIAGLLAEVIPGGSTVLDVGCGDGGVARALLAARPDLRWTGVEVMPRSESAGLPVASFDGRALPFGDRAFDRVLLVDVLHHADDAAALLRECRRVARAGLIVKDHVRSGWLARQRLLWMDRVGNRRHGVPSPGRYLSWSEWTQLFAEVGLVLRSARRRLALYPFPVSLLCDRGLQALFVLDDGTVA